MLAGWKGGAGGMSAHRHGRWLQPRPAL